MSKRSTTNKLNKNVTNSISNNNNSSSNKQYNLIINQNSTFNQDNSINIMLDGSFPYFQNHNYQANETEPSNQLYPLYQDYQTMKTSNNQNDSQKKSINTNTNNKNNNYFESFNSKIMNSTESQKKENSPPRGNDNDIKNYDKMSQGSTNKIDYRYIKKCPFNEIISTFKNGDNDIDVKDKENQLFWLATYGKLMKTKNLIKIFNYYNNKPFKPLNYNNSYSNIKEKTLVIKDFEICFYENSNKPYIRYSKGGSIYTKLYLLTIKQINQVFSYINRIEYKINYDRLNYLQRKGNFEIINDNSNGIILPYCLIYYLGKYMNTNIYSFSNIIDFNLFIKEVNSEKNQKSSPLTINNNDNTNDNYYNNNNNKNNINIINNKHLNYKLPSSKKILKLIKIINLNFPDFSIEDIINYLIPDNKYINSVTKKIEIKNIFFFKKSNQNKIILSSMVRDTIKGISIQTPKSLLSSFCPAESLLDNNSYKNSDLFQPITNKKYTLPIKDDYKFQTISTTEKDNNKNNPLVIYVYDNNQKNNYIDNQSTTIQNNNKAMKRYDNYTNINTNEPEKKIQYIKTENNQESKITRNMSKSNNIPLDNNYNQLNNNKSLKIPKEKINLKRKSIDIKIKKNKYGNDMNNIFMTGVKKDIKLQRISTDIKEKNKYGKNKSLTSDKINKNRIRETNVISRTNNKTDINNRNKGALNKSIDSQNLKSSKHRLSRTSDINQRRKQKTKNYNNKLLINRINMNKKNNPFSIKNS